MMIRGKEVSAREVAESWVGIIGGAVAILAAIGSFALWAMAHFQSADDAAKFAADSARTNAWQSCRIANSDARALRNRLNDCAVLKERGPLTPMERSACEQYADEFVKAQAGAESECKRAKDLSR